MRVIVCSAGISGKFEGFHYSFDKKFINGFIRLGHSVIHFADRDIADSYFLNLRQLGRHHANNKLLNIARSFQPDLIALFQADVIDNRCLATIKRDIPHCLITNIDCDLITSERKINRLLQRKAICDRTFITSAGQPLRMLRELGLNADYIPNPTDASIESRASYAYPSKSYDLVYFCSAPENSFRWEFANRFQTIAPEIVFGRFGSQSRIYGQRYFDILDQSRMALNWSSVNNIPLYSSDRIAQLFGSGVCVCLATSSGFQQFIGENEALYFDDAESLHRNIRASLAKGDWAERARLGREQYRRLFNETRCAEYVIRKTFLEDVSNFEWHSI